MEPFFLLSTLVLGLLDLNPPLGGCLSKGLLDLRFGLLDSFLKPLGLLIGLRYLRLFDLEPLELVLYGLLRRRGGLLEKLRGRLCLLICLNIQLLPNLHPEDKKNLHGVSAMGSLHFPRSL